MGTSIWKFSSAALQALEAVGANSPQARQLLVRQLMNQGVLGKAKGEFVFYGVRLMVQKLRHGYQVRTPGEPALARGELA
jgi:hypothetical protein